MRTRRNRGGFTLVEMLLVLAILVIITAIAWPVMQGPFRKHRIKTAVTKVHSRLANTRTYAVDAGLIYQFRFEPNGRRYLVIPYERDADDLADGGGQQSSATGSGGVYRPRFSESLPEGYEFDVENPSDVSNAELQFEQIPRELLNDFPDAHKLSAVNWSPPILFFADGSSQQAMFIVKDDKKQFMRLSVRELTGAVSLSRVMNEGR